MEGIHLPYGRWCQVGTPADPLILPSLDPKIINSSCGNDGGEGREGEKDGVSLNLWSLVTPAGPLPSLHCTALHCTVGVCRSLRGFGFIILHKVGNKHVHFINLHVQGV
jgi:hypothetical protein